MVLIKIQRHIIIIIIISNSQPFCSSRQVLEVDSSARSVVDIGNIVSDESKPAVKPLGASRRTLKTERANSENFVDNPDVPALLWEV